MSDHILPAEVLTSFPPGTFLENIAIDATGEIFVTSFEEGAIYQIHPTGEKKLFTTTDGKLAGICNLADQLFLVNGLDHHNIPTLYLVYDNAKQVPLIHPPGAQFFNGMTAVNDHLFLICDSYKGCLWLYDISLNEAAIWLQHPLLARTDNTNPMPAANGIKIHDRYVFVSNTAKQLLIKIPLIGMAPGQPEILLDHINLDDFVVGENEIIYATTHIYNSVVKITADNSVSTIGEAAQGLTGSTAVAFSPDKQYIYITTNGGISLPPAGGLENAKIIKIKLS